MEASALIGIFPNANKYWDEKAVWVKRQTQLQKYYSLPKSIFVGEY